MNNLTFNIRVYGLLFGPDSRILITDEFRLNMFMTKFPGGGLEPGEGTIDCLKRECREELGQEPCDIQHFYTTDFFQPTEFLDQRQQLISIYYTGILKKPFYFTTTNKPLDINKIDGAQNFRWVNPLLLMPDDLTMPIDKIVIGKLKDSLKQQAI